MKEIFFNRFDIAVHADPLELKNTLMCQLWHVGCLRVNRFLNGESDKEICEPRQIFITFRKMKFCQVMLYLFLE